METYYGYVRTPADAIKLFEACRLGLLPRVQRRLSEKERTAIRSGSVFVWDEREAGMRRWTDGKSWSASRVSGSFLTYREMEGKRGSGFGNSRRSNGRTPDSGRHSDEDLETEPEGYRYKADGLMKQSFSITTSQGQHLHLISYYSRPHPGAPDLPQPSTDPSLRQIIPAKGMYPESSLHEANPPALTRAPMQPYTNHGPPEQPAYTYAWGTPSWIGPWPPSPNEHPHWAHGRLPADMRPQPLPHHTSPPRPPHPHPHHHHHPALSAALPLPPNPSPSGQGPLHANGINHYEHERLIHHPTTGRPYHLVPVTTHPAYAPQAPLVPHAPPAPPAPHTPHARRAHSLSPRSHHLQIQAAQAAQTAQAVLIDPRLATTSARNPQGPLPVMPAAAPTAPPRLTPPRTRSVSPPRSAHSDTNSGVKKTSLSALLHPTPASSEPNSANPANPNNSANNSPRALNSTTGAGAATASPATTVGPAGASNTVYREDAKALRSLDRKFCI